MEMTAVCDLWTVNREKAWRPTQHSMASAPRAFKHPEELLALSDVDAVIISTPEHSAFADAETGCRGRQGRVLSKSPWATCSRKSRPRVTRCEQHNVIVQIGTQHRSEPYPNLARETHSDRRSWRRQQDRDRLELSRSALARPSGSGADPRSRIPTGQTWLHGQAAPSIRSAPVF